MQSVALAVGQQTAALEQNEVYGAAEVQCSIVPPYGQEGK